jgi:hypothetical protein
MKKLIDTAFANFAKLPPQEQAKVKAAWGSIGLFFLYLLYVAVTDRWQKALGIFMAMAVFLTVVILAASTANILKKFIGTKAADMVCAILILGFIGFVLYIIGANWGR